MIRTADAYRQGLRDGREVWMDNERVADVTTHPALKPIIDVKARESEGPRGHYVLTSAYIGYLLPMMVEIQYWEYA